MVVNQKFTASSVAKVELLEKLFIIKISTTNLNTLLTMLIII